MSEIRTAAHWLILAEDAKATAEQIHDPSAKRTMLAIALGYEKLARHAALLASTRMPTEASAASSG
jgi:hypothetical protein